MKPDGSMRLDSLATVNRIADARRALLHRIAVVEAPVDETSVLNPKFCVTVDGERMGSDVTSLLRPVLVRELRAQVAELERDLEALGVNV